MDEKVRRLPLAAVMAIIMLLGISSFAYASPVLRGDRAEQATPGDERDDAAEDASADATREIDEDLTEGGSRAGESDGGSRPSPSGRQQDVDFGIRLQSARIEQLNLDDSDDEFVMFEFADNVVEVRDRTAFLLQGVASTDTVRSTDARLVDGDTSAVLVRFRADTDLLSYSQGIVEANAVRDETGKGNPPGGVTLDGSRVATGVTSGPDLLSVEVSETLDRALFEFDEELDESAGNASGFGFYTSGGREETGRRVAAIDDSVVVVEFDDQIEDGARFYVDVNAVRDTGGQGNPASARGTATSLPDLVRADQVGRAQVDYVFDEDVADVDASDFVVYTEDGQSYRGESYSRPGPETVRIAYPAIDDFSDALTLATVTGGAAGANDGSRAETTIGSATIGSGSADAGATSGPDLVDARFDSEAGQITFVFDEIVDDDVTIEPARLKVIDDSGDIGDGRAFVEVDGNEVTITFDKNLVEAAVGATIDANAVRDEQGNGNPIHAIER